MEMCKKRIVVTGAQGFLGSRVVTYYNDAFDAIALSHAALDITNRQVVIERLSALRPSLVIHCAAISDTGYAQQHPEESEQINLWGTLHVAEACKICGAKLVYMSSDQVYNGNAEEGLLPESVPVHPVSVYGQHKLAAEKEVDRILPSAVGLRLTWMYDLPTTKMKLNRNILVNLRSCYDSHETMHVAVREYRGITSIWEVVKRLIHCAELPGGIYNFGCENDQNSYETFLEAAHSMQLPHPEEWIIADPERFPGHPRNLSMKLDKLRTFGMDFPSTCQGFQTALSED